MPPKLIRQIDFLAGPTAALEKYARLAKFPLKTW
jgi:hypothetical protein